MRVTPTASYEKQLKDKLRAQNFGRLCVFEWMPGIFRVNGTGLADRWCGTSRRRRRRRSRPLFLARRGALQQKVYYG